MADLFDIFLKKKRNNAEGDNEEQKNNYSIYMPVGIYEDVDTGSKEKKPFDVPEESRVQKSQSQQKRRPNYREDIKFYDIDNLELEQQIEELKRMTVDFQDEVNLLKDKIAAQNKTINELSMEKSRHEYAKNTYRNLLTDIVRKLPYYKEIEFTGIGEPEHWTEPQLVQIFIKSIEDVANKLIQETKAREQERKRWQEQFEKLQSGIAQSDAGQNAAPPKTGEIKVDEYAKKPPEPKTGIIEFPVFGSDDENQDISQDFGVTPDAGGLSKYIEKLSDPCLGSIIKCIGETGLSRITDMKENEDIKASFNTKSGEFNQALFSQKIQGLADLTLLEKDTINTKRKGGVEHIYCLTELGRSIFQAMYKKGAEESEKFKILRQHSSLEHGYFIKTVARELRNKGYEVYEEHKDCQIEIEGSKNKVECDLLGIKNGERCLIECEMGTTSDADMTKKLDKLMLVTKMMYFLAPNQDAMNSTRIKVDKWIKDKGGSKGLKGYGFKFSTIDMIKKNDIWSNTGPF